MRQHIIIVLLFMASLGGAIAVKGQVSDSIILTTTLEKISELSEEDPDYQSIAEGPGGERLRSIQLSSITEQQLRHLPFLTEIQTSQMLKYIQETGQILSVYELRAIPGLDTATIRRLLPYLTPGDPDQGLILTGSNLLRRGRHELLLYWGEGLENKKGYRTHLYSGSRLKELFRYSYSFSNRIKAAISGEKDPGEQFFGPSQRYGMDYYAGYVALMNTGFLKSLIIGNFTASFGQGLVAGTGSRLGSVVGFNAPLRVSQGVRGSSSTYEGSYQRGVATSVRFNRFTISALFSRHPRDGNALISDSTENTADRISSFQSTGYHRTAAEIADKNAVKETVVGGNICVTGTFFRIGATALHGSWSAGIRPDAKPYNLWYFRGRSMTVAGLDFIVRLKYITLFGEGGTSCNGAWAWVGGISAEPVQDVLFSVTLRSYDPAYVNLFSNGFSQGSRNSNERGCLINVNAQLFPSLTLAAYADLFRRPWLIFRVNEPSEGMEAGVLATFTGCTGLILSGRALFREYEQNDESMNGPVPSTSRFSTLSVRCQADWRASQTVTLKTQFEWKGGLKGFPGRSSGCLAGQEVRADLLKRRMQLSFRYVLFDVPSWDLRIYSYEPDLTGSFSVPGYNGKGIRAMVMAKGRITKYLNWWVKYGVTWYENKTAIGTGLEEIKGNVQSEVKLQIALNI